MKSSPDFSQTGKSVFADVYLCFMWFSSGERPPIKTVGK